MSQFNKHEVDLSKLVPGDSTVWYYNPEEQKDIIVGKYLGPADDNYLQVDFDRDGVWEVDPDCIIKIVRPDRRWD
jgi:hypothetical protein